MGKTMMKWCSFHQHGLAVFQRNQQNPIDDHLCPNRQRLNKITRALHQFSIQRHGGADGIRIRNQGEFFSWVEQMLLTFRNDLGEIAVIVLLVSGIGNMESSAGFHFKTMFTTTIERL